MKLIIINSGNRISIDFDSKVKINSGTLHSLKELVTLKDIEKEVREYLGVENWRTRVMPGYESTTIHVGDDGEFNRIRTIVRRDNIIEKLLKND